MHSCCANAHKQQLAEQKDACKYNPGTAEGKRLPNTERLTKTNQALNRPQYNKKGGRGVSNLNNYSTGHLTHVIAKGFSQTGGGEEGGKGETTYKHVKWSGGIKLTV